MKLLANSLRGLLRHKRFTAAACSLLAIGIGFAVALASLADAILFRPLPVPDPGAIVRVYSASKLHSMGYVSYPDYVDFAHLSSTVSGMVAQTQILGAMSDQNMAEVPRIRLGLAASANYFDALKIAPFAGRLFRPADAQSPVIVLSHAFWQSRYRASSCVIGKNIEVRKSLYTIIGIAPPGFGMDRFLHEDFYVPIEAYAARLPEGSPLRDRSRRFLAIYARAKTNTAAVAAELNALAHALEQSSPDTNRGQHVLVLTEADARRQENGTLPAVAAVLLALAALVLLAACASVSGLILLRRQERAGETALRSALGATTARLFAETLLESFVLAFAGLGAGLLLGRAALALIQNSIPLPSDVPMSVAARLDPRMIALAALAAFVAALVCGIVPQLSLQRSRHLPPAASARITRDGRARRIFLAAQLALALVLVGLAIQFYTHMRSLRQIPLGYRTDHVLVMSFDPAQVGATEIRARQFYRDLLDRVKALPGVRRASLAQTVPLGPTGAQKQVRMLGTAETDATSVWSNIVAPGYFELIHISFVDGRAFTGADSNNATPVAIVNETLARHWPGARATGRIIEVAGRRVEIVGVVRAAKYIQINEAPLPFIYLPFSQNYVSHLTLHIETSAQPSTLAPAVLAAVREIDSSQPVNDVHSLDDYFTRGALFGVHLGATLAAFAALVALALALAGLYASASEAMRKQRREIGIRLALGAAPTAILRLALCYAAGITALGCLFGIPILLILAGALDQIIPNQTPPVESLPLRLYWLVAVLLVSGAGLVSSSIPVAKAARIDPAIALRELS